MNKNKEKILKMHLKIDGKICILHHHYHFHKRLSFMKALLVNPLSLKLFVLFKRKLLNYIACVTFSITFFIFEINFHESSLSFTRTLKRMYTFMQNNSNTFVQHFLGCYILYQKNNRCCSF